MSKRVKRVRVKSFTCPGCGRRKRSPSRACISKAAERLICDSDCAARFARRMRMSVIGEHRTIHPGRSVMIEYIFGDLATVTKKDRITED